MNAPNLIIRTNRVFYHFTASRFIPDIQREGLTKGALPWHRCPKTGEPLCIRNFHERGMNARQLANIRANEQKLTRAAREGNPIAVKQLPKLFPGFQWLTTSGDWGQPFCLLGELPFAKNAQRITLLLPANRVVSWRSVCERAKPPSAEEINTPAVDWENWWIHEGPISPSHFLEVARNPGDGVAAGLMEGHG